MTADTDPSNPFPPLAKQGPSLLGGIYTVDDASFTTRIKFHSGPTATTRYHLIALPDTGSPQTFLAAEAWARMKTCGAATNITSYGSSRLGWFWENCAPSYVNFRPPQRAVLAWRHPFR